MIIIIFNYMCVCVCIYIKGYGLSADAYHGTSPNPQGDGQLVRQAVSIIYTNSLFILHNNILCLLLLYMYLLILLDIYL